MSQTSGPYGLTPVNKLGQKADTVGTRSFTVTSNSANGLFFGDLVNITGGQISRITATPTTVLGTATPIGVFGGVRFVDSTGFPQWGILPANAITGGDTQVVVRVYDDPDQLFRVQADGTVPLTDIGKNAGLTGFTAPSGNGNTTSLVQLQTSSINTTSTLGLRIVDVDTPTDSYSDVIVKFNVGVHAYDQGTGQ